MIMGRFEVEKETHNLMANPDDTKAREDLAMKVSKLESRASTDPSGLITIANANLVLGDTLKAKEAAKKATRLNPNFAPVKELNKRIKP